jgi:hypothetical protein
LSSSGDLGLPRRLRYDLRRRDLACHQRRIGEMADANGHVVAFADDIHEAVAEVELDAHVRALSHEARDGRPEMQGAERHRRRNA